MKLIETKHINALGKAVTGERFNEKSKTKKTKYISNSMAVQSMLEAGARSNAMSENLRPATEKDYSPLDMQNFDPGLSRFGDKFEVVEAGRKADERIREQINIKRANEQAKKAEQAKIEQARNEASKAGDKA
jgi:hypothetical protein